MTTLRVIMLTLSKLIKNNKASVFLSCSSGIASGSALVGVKRGKDLLEHGIRRLNKNHMPYTWKTLSPRESRSFYGLSVGDNYIAFSTLFSKEILNFEYAKVFIDPDKKALRFEFLKEWEKDSFKLQFSSPSVKIGKTLNGVPRGRYAKELGDENIFTFIEK